MTPLRGRCNSRGGSGFRTRPASEVRTARREEMSAKSWRSLVLTGVAVVLGSVIGGNTPTIAGSDNDPRTYAGDYQGGSLPIGTFIAFQYASFSHADAFVDPTGHALPDSHANTWVEFTRVTYFAELANRPFVIEADLPFATLTDVNIPGTNNQVAGGLVDPVFHLTYFLISDAKVQRWFGFTNFFWLPVGRSFDNRSAINVSTPRQFTDTPQFGYTEGLGKISPSLNGLFFDLIANASFHTDGDSPLEVVNPLQGEHRLRDSLSEILLSPAAPELEKTVPQGAPRRCRS